MAALANVTVILPFWGAMGAIVIWATQKDKSPYVAFQSLQAVVYHLVLILGGFLAGACYVCSLLAFPLTMAGIAASQPSADFGPLLIAPMAIPFLILGLSVVAWLVFLLYGLVAAAANLQGKEFRYLLIGRRLEQYLAQP